ncbi:hypothetical protein [Nocardia fluminea]|uniref:Uncharacterized protein n=1 Tax=Nocardia fluminea TaxID=134984 RepID=A0A2N3VCK1_9NOCA|nr:hypothetical protein [Nocardia fluminea]PKV79350.1 hypothetical protein ATK86_3742 [Nocardia fluminea]
MSKRKNTATARPASAGPAPDTAPAAPDGGSGAAGVPVLRTDNDRALWAALGTHPGGATAVLAAAAGVSLSTARRVLLGWKTAGAVRSHSDAASPRATKTWTAVESAAPVPAGQEPATPDPTPADPAAPDVAVVASTGDDPADPAPVTPAPDDDAVAAEQESVVRLPAGALRGQVEDFLRDHPDDEYSPHQIGKALDRSGGAVHNALLTLTKAGTARQTSTAPKRFTLASA